MTAGVASPKSRLVYLNQCGEFCDRVVDPLELQNLRNKPSAQADKAMVMDMMMRERISLEEMAPRATYCA